MGSREMHIGRTACLLPVVVCLAATFLGAVAAEAAKGTVMCPLVTERSEKIPFAGHEGWVDVYGPGDSTGRSARIGKDGSYELNASGDSALIASFDHVDALPIIVPRWPALPGQYDISVWGDYICMPAGYPEVWDAQYKVKGKEHYQTFTARSSYLYGITAFDGPKVIWWGNKVHGGVHERSGTNRIAALVGVDRFLEGFQTAHHSDHSFPFMGWRHGDVPMVPGESYSVHISGYRSHGGEHFDLETFVRPDKGDGYRLGRAYTDNETNALDGDLCLIVQGNSNGQIVENNIRSEEQDVKLPKQPPAGSWGQSFLAHGRSMAGMVFWASSISEQPHSCKVRIREGGPGGKVTGPTKTAVGHECPTGPFIRYPEWPGPAKGFEEYHKLKPDTITGDTKTGYYAHSRLFQVAYLSDESPLEPGVTYYVDLEFNVPVIILADGDPYRNGLGYREGEKMENDRMFGAERWTIAGQIVTYENPGGAPNR